MFRDNVHRDVVTYRRLLLFTNIEVFLPKTLLKMYSYGLSLLPFILEETAHVVDICMYVCSLSCLSADLGYSCPGDIGSGGSVSKVGTGSSVHRIYTILEYLCIIILEFGFHLHEIETSFQA